MNGKKPFRMAFRKASPRINRVAYEKISKSKTTDKTSKSTKAPTRPLRGVILPNRANTLSLDSTDSPFILDDDAEDNEAPMELAKTRRGAAIANAVEISHRAGLSNGHNGTDHDVGKRCLSALMSARSQVRIGVVYLVSGAN